VIFIYPLIPRKFNFLGWFASFGATPVVFRGLLVAFTTAYNIKVLVSGYQSIDMQRIMLPVKFDSGLFISALRNKQLYTKKGGSKLHIFKKFQNFFYFANPTL
jgi:hypothetical protein